MLRTQCHLCIAFGGGFPGLLVVCALGSRTVCDVSPAEGRNPWLTEKLGPKGTQILIGEDAGFGKSHYDEQCYLGDFVLLSLHQPYRPMKNGLEGTLRGSLCG